jgi:hypothetical protein
MAKNGKGEAERKDVVRNGEEKMRKVRKRGRLTLREREIERQRRMRRNVGYRRRSRWSGRCWGERMGKG